MSDESKTGSEIENSSDQWKSLSPEELMTVLLHELKTPVAELRDLAGNLASGDEREQQPLSSESIAQKIAQLQKIYDILGEYMRDHGQSVDS